MKRSRPVRIAPASSSEWLIARVASWHWGEWGRCDPRGSERSWARALSQRLRTSEARLLLAWDGAIPVGSVSLVPNDMDSGDPTWAEVVGRWRGAKPWLSGLYVAPEWRGRGVGAALANACEADARRAAAPVLHLHTAAARGLFERRGYVVLGTERYEGEETVVMRKTLFADA